MGGIVIRVEMDKQTGRTYQFNAQSLDVANFMSLNGIKVISGVGDSYNGTVTFDMEAKKLTINSDYFDLPDSALLFWRTLGFIVIINKSKKKLTYESPLSEQKKVEP